MNKFGRSPGYGRNVRDMIDGVPVDDLVSEYGSPLFVYSEASIRQKHQEVSRAFSCRYPNVTLAWSYKTNYLGAICALMHEEGSIAEVVSGMEYEMARSLGMPGDQIIFNGPMKTMDELERAVREGAMIHIDHMDELEDLERLARKLDQNIPVGLRLNLDAGIQPQWSRFGFNLETGQAAMAVERMAQSGRLILQGLHCHIGTFILDPEAYGRQIAKMVSFGYAMENAYGFSIEYFDIGGGLPSRNRLKGSYYSADIAVPAVDEYAGHICSALLANLRPGHFPQLILESGRAMIDEAGSLISTVVATKRLPDGTRAYVVDAGVNLLFTSYWYKFNIEVDRATPGLSENSVIYGSLCMNIDVLDESIQLPPLPRGTRLIVNPVGAYNNTQWLQFIHYRPNVVLIGLDGSVDCIRQAEDLTDITRREMLPERLQPQPEADEAAA